MLRQHKFLTQLVQQLDKDPAAAQQVLDTRNVLLNNNNNNYAHADLVTRPLCTR